MDWGGEKIESPPRLGLGTIYSTLHGMTDLLPKHMSGVQVWGWEGIRHQPHLTHGSASIHCVLRFNLIKGILNIVILDSHTHQHISSNQHGIFIQNPNIHLSCNLYHHFQGSNQTNISYPNQKHRHVKHVKQTNYHI